MIKEAMIRRDNRHVIEDACLYVHRQHSAQSPPDDARNSYAYPIENISRGGLRFFSHDPYRVNERIEITLRLANGKTHSAMARICYRHDNNKDADCCCYGVSFLDHFLEIAACLRD
jgi:hypothetical protein